jgi:hypothetical protein
LITNIEHSTLSASAGYFQLSRIISDSVK